jgi:hypothetical protein
MRNFGRWFGRWRVIILILIVLLWVTGSLIMTPVSAQSADFLTIRGTLFDLNGQTIYLRGTNISNIGGLGIWQTPNMDGIQSGREDYFKLKEMGGNHVRFGISLPWYNQDRARFWRELDQQVAWAKDAGVWFLPLLFVTEDNCYEGYSNTCDIWTDKSEQDRFIAFWVEMARHYKDEPTVVGFDFLNEPTPPGPRWCETWFDFAQRIRDAVFAVHPRALAFIESCSDGQFSGLLRGSNIVYQVHHYLPLAASHNEDGTAVYPGWLPDWDGKSVYWSKETMRGGGEERADVRHRLAIAWAAEHNVPIYIGEWGTRSPYNGWETYLTDVASLLNEWGTHWAHYSWRHMSGWWDTFPPEGPLVPQNIPTYRMLLWAFRGLLGPGEMPTPTPIKPTQLPQPTATTTGIPPTIQATATMRSATATAMPLATATPLQPTRTLEVNESLVIRYRARKTSEMSSTIELLVSIANVSSVSVSLEDVTARYYFSDDGALGDYIVRCEMAYISCRRVRAWFGQLPVARDEATHYLEIGFRGVRLVPGTETGPISLQIHRHGWRDFRQSDDFSFDPSRGPLRPWPRIPLYRDGRLIWGVEPQTWIKPTPSVAALRLLYRTQHPEADSSVIAPIVEIDNPTGRSISLSRLHIRYYFTRDLPNLTSSLLFQCDWAQVGCHNITVTFGTLSDPSNKADSYLEIGFKDTAGALAPFGKSGPIMLQFHRNDWHNFDQANDWSFNPSAQRDAAMWERVTLYLDNQLIWGIEPSQ